MLITDIHHAPRIPYDDYHLEVALSHYKDLAMTSGLSLSQYAGAISRDRGFLDDHECVGSLLYDVMCAHRSRLGIRSCSTSWARCSDQDDEWQQGCAVDKRVYGDCIIRFNLLLGCTDMRLCY